jgi:hypothetical protein
MTKKLNIMIIALLALVLMMIAPVSAETVTGTLGEIGSNSTYYTTTSGAGSSGFNVLAITGIQYTTGTRAIVLMNTVKNQYSAGAEVGTSVPMILTVPGSANVTIGTGYIGYQRAYSALGVELPGYTYIQFDTYDPGILTGDKSAKIWCNETALGLTNYGGNANGYAPPSGYFGFGSQPNNIATGQYLVNKDVSTSNDYSATRSSGWITGYITKNVGGQNYSSQAFLFNASGYTLSSQSTATTDRFNFTVYDQSIKLGILTPGLMWYNTSVLFAAATPTVTPTPTTTIPPGYVRNNLYVWDQNDAQISGADIDVLDVEAATWTNRTADADGWITIDTLPYHTVNIYAHYPTSNIYLPNEILGLETGYYGGHNWVLVLYPYVSTPSGYVTLYINTRNYDTKAVLTGVNLQIKNLVTGAITGESTGSTDSASTVVTNATNYQITGSKAGYLSKTVVINSGEAASKTVVLELSRATASPTPTPTLSGQPTAVPTQDENDPILHDGDTSLKAQEMMNWLAMNGMMLVQLCFLVTIFALLGVKLGK